MTWISPNPGSSTSSSSVFQSGFPLATLGELSSTWVYVNPSAGTVHHAVLKQAGVAGCGFYFGASGKAVALRRLQGE